MDSLAALAWLISAIGSPPDAPSVRYEAPATVDPYPYWRSADHACGPLCLSFLSHYLGDARPYAEVVAHCSPGPRGTSLRQLRAAGKDLGYNAVPFRGSVQQLKMLRYPAILHCAGEAQPAHFVVLLGWDSDRQRFDVFNPPKGLQETSLDRLAQKFSGVGLIVSKTGPSTLEDAAPTNRSRIAWMWIAILAIDLLVAAAAVVRLFGSVFARLRTNRSAASSLCLLAMSLVLPSCQPPDGNNSAAQDNAASHEFEFDAGIVLPGALVGHTFRIRNPTDEILRIETVSTVDS